MIEEFMLAANEAVAEFMVSGNVPVMFRIHEEPDRTKLEEFLDTARGMGLNLELPERITPGWFQKVLGEVAGTPREYMINAALLRTMQQAVYSERNEGHFGLASRAYLHFTSPIRRYPDLVVHRILKGNLRKVRKHPVYTTEKLASLAIRLSDAERKAVDAEREMLDRLKAAYMAERVGQTFPAIISSVTPAGFFVELKDIFISGLVRLESLGGKEYRFDRSARMIVGKRSGRKYVAGNEVTVRVRSVSLERRRIDFEPVD
jgi:ribonuclease R